jgi:hypothetical protein
MGLLTNEYRTKRPYNTTLEQQTVDYSLSQKDYAIYTPSISINYSSYGMHDNMESFGVKTKGYAPNSRMPSVYHPNGDENNYLQRDNGNFYYPYCLFSAGHAELDINKIVNDKSNSMIHSHGNDSVVIGDSGGYQISTGVIPIKWGDPNSLNDWRMKILRWLEATADYTPTLDIPTGIIHKSPQAGYKTVNDCLNGTVENLKFFVKNRVPGATNFLNVLQGRTVAEADMWYDTVKVYPFEGWTMAGNCAGDFEIVMHQLIRLRDEKQISDDKHWLHYLGVSRLGAACAFTTLQRILRQQVSPRMTISYDSSSPFLSVAKGGIYTNIAMNQCQKNKQFGPVVLPAPDDRKYMNSTMLLQEWLEQTYGTTSVDSTAISRKLPLGEICRDGASPTSRSSWDTISYMHIMNHNIECHVRGIQRANVCYDLPYEEASKYIPYEVLYFRDIIAPEVFNSETPFDTIKKYKTDLTNFIDMKVIKPVIDNSVSKFFGEELMREHIEVEEKTKPQPIIISDKAKSLFKF